jgi:DNA polymerase epsilon subunit 1
MDYIEWDVNNNNLPPNQQYFTELNQCLKAIDLKLQDYKHKFKGASILVIQSELSPEKLMFMGLPSISNEFPCMKCPQISSDNDYPALDWIRFACKQMTSRFIEMPEWIKERINFSRYSYIPICNLEQDSSIFIIDTLYARNLAMNKHILWYSDTSKPDLGGHEDRDYRIYF